MDRGLAWGIGGLVVVWGSGWGLWEVRRLDGGLTVGVVVVGRRLMERELAVVSAVMVELMTLWIEVSVRMALAEVGQRTLILTAL